jgi:hypothetical protein
MSYRRLILLMLFFVLDVMTISADEPALAMDINEPHRSPSPEGARVHFKALKSGAVLPATFTVGFVVEGMEIAPAGSNIDNSGHHHLLIDVSELPDMNRPLPATEQVRHFGKGQTATELSLEEGEHTLQLLFADYLHTPHKPPLMSEKISITVSAEGVP